MNIKRVVTVALTLSLLLCVTACGGQPEPETGYTAIDNLQTLLDRVTRTLSGVRSTATAEEALPTLEAVSEEFELLIDRLPRLTPAARTEIAAQAARALPGLKDNARRINNGDGIDLLGPTMNMLVDQLARML